jgi:chaperonin GroES
MSYFFYQKSGLLVKDCHCPTEKPLLAHKLTKLFLFKRIKKHKNIKNMATLNIKPLADRVLVEPAEAEQKTASGIIIPDTAKEKPQKGVVVAVGNGTKDVTMTVKVGDNVLYGKYSGTEISYEGKTYLIMRESDIYAII